MKESWVNPFLGSVIDVWRQEFGQTVRKIGLTSSKDGVLDGEISIIFNVQGSIEGVVLYEMSLATAKKIASKKSGSTVHELDKPALGPFTHVMNAIVRQAVFELGQVGLQCRTTPPKIFQSPGRQFSHEQPPTLVGVVFGSDFGEIKVRVGLREGPEDTKNVEWLMSQSGLTRR